MTTPNRAERVRDWLDNRIPATWTFVLRRAEDPTGISGVGAVADGCVFPDGKAVTRWRGGTTGVAQTCVWDSIGHVRAIHGHQAATRIEPVPYSVLVEMVLEALDAAADLTAAGEDGDPVIDAIAAVLDDHEREQAEIESAARGSS